MKYIIISGIDGSGKTSIISKLYESLKQKKISSIVVWMRYNHVFVKPLHAIARVIGLSKKYSSTSGYVWRHEIYNSVIFSKIYIWATYADTLLGYLWLKTKLSNNHKIVICDRWINDILIDLGTKTRNENFLESKWYFLFKKILPKNNFEFLIIREIKYLLSCRVENREDKDFNFRLKLYEKLKSKENTNVIQNNKTVKIAVEEILNIIL